MKHLLILFVAALFFYSCRPSDSHFEVQGVGYDEMNGQTIYLWKLGKDLISQEMVIDSSVVVDGTFRFTGPADTLSMYHIDSGIPFFPEQGLTVFNTVLPLVKGSPRNAELWRLWKEKGFPQKETSDFMKSNISNALGVYLFDRQAATDPNDLEYLYNHIHPQMRDYSPVISLQKQLHSTQAIHPGSSFDDFERTDISNKNIKLSDIAGKGKPVCLIFLFDHNGIDKVKSHITELNQSRSGTIYMVISQYSADPNFKDFRDKIYRDIVDYWIEDDNRFEQSVRYQYRIRNAINYIVLITSNGDVEANYVFW